MFVMEQISTLPHLPLLLSHPQTFVKHSPCARPCAVLDSGVTAVNNTDKESPLVGSAVQRARHPMEELSLEGISGKERACRMTDPTVHWLYGPAQVPVPLCASDKRRLTPLLDEIAIGTP